MFKDRNFIKSIFGIFSPLAYQPEYHIKRQASKPYDSDRFRDHQARIKRAAEKRSRRAERNIRLCNWDPGLSIRSLQHR